MSQVSQSIKDQRVRLDQCDVSFAIYDIFENSKETPLIFFHICSRRFKSFVIYEGIQAHIYNIMV